MPTVLVTYDDSDDRRRRKIAKALERAGRRVQQSVFLVEGKDASPATAEAVMSPHLPDRPDDLDIRIVPLCKSCRSRTILIGQARAKDRRAPVGYRIV